MSLANQSSDEYGSVFARIVEHASTLEEILQALVAVPGITRVELRDKVVKTYPPQREFEIDWRDERGTHNNILAVSESPTSGYAYVGVRPLTEEL